MASPRSNDTSTPEPDAEPTISITVTLGPTTKTFTLPASGTLDDLTVACEDAFDDAAATTLPTSTGPNSQAHDWTTHKFIAPSPIGLLKGSEHSESPLAPLAGKKLRLLAAKLAEVDSLRAAEQSAVRRAARRAVAHATGRKYHHAANTRRHHLRHPEDSTYTFMSLRPLPHLPDPGRSLAYLERLRADPGIRTVMRRHRFTVGLLTEMDPAEHTTASHEGVGRTLGLNRNKGEVIELRLRTDAGDGYRDYRTVRRTLCHELAHNVHGPHDRQFWDLCHAIEREVEAADWTGAGSGGRTLGDGPGFGDEEEYDAPDHGGWTGGEFVLGGGGVGRSSGSGAAGPTLTRREILAKAAEERLRRMNQERRDGREQS